MLLPRRERGAWGEASFCALRCAPRVAGWTKLLSMRRPFGLGRRGGAGGGLADHKKAPLNVHWPATKMIQCEEISAPECWCSDAAACMDAHTTSVAHHAWGQEQPVEFAFGCDVAELRQQIKGMRSPVREWTLSGLCSCPYALCQNPYPGMHGPLPQFGEFDTIIPTHIGARIDTRSHDPTWRSRSSGCISSRSAFVRTHFPG